jgi:hypothetical protein
MIQAARATQQRTANPVFGKWVADWAEALDASAVAEVDGTEDIDSAATLLAAALSVLRVVQNVQHPMSDKSREKFGLIGEVAYGVLDYVIVGDKMTVGASRVGALAGWEFSDDDYNAWSTDPAYRFLDEPLTVGQAERTELQQRALLGIEMLSQAWLTFQPDVSLLNSVMALEVLLGETNDQAKKFRLARRIAYLFCAWPTEQRHFDGTLPAVSLYGVAARWPERSLGRANQSSPIAPWPGRVHLVFTTCWTCTTPGPASSTTADWIGKAFAVT